MDLAYDILISNFSRLKFPYKVIFAITYRCNSRCKLCNIWKKKSRNELTESEIKLIAKRIKFKWINITGGEPFLRRDLARAIEYFIHYSGAFVFNITTNGLVKEKILSDVSRLVKKYPSAVFVVSVSVDGPKKVHDKLRGIKIWDKAVSTFSELKELSKKHKNLHSFISYTVSHYNYKYIFETFLDLKNKVPDIKPENIHFNFVHVSETYYSNLNLKIPKAFKKKAYENLCKFWKQNIFTPLFFLDGIYIKKLKYFIEKGKTPIPCKALNASLFLDPYGNVYPCTHFNVKLGNIRDTDYKISTIWNSVKAKTTWQKIRKNKCPQCWTPCETYQTILGNLSRVLI